MPKRATKLYLEDIKDSIRKIERYIRGLNFDEFIQDLLTIDAVMRNLTIIEEATKNIPDVIKSKNTDIPWTEIVGMKNKITYEYFGVNKKILWKAIKEDLPIFKKQISELLEKI